MPCRRIRLDAQDRDRHASGKSLFQRTILLAIILLLSAALAPTRAVADVTETPGATRDRGGAGIIDTDEEAVRRLLDLFRAAQLSLGEAMMTAEKLHKGSRIVQISFDISGSPGYRVRTLKNDEIWENVIDAQTGNITGDAVVLYLKELSGEDRGNITALKSVKQELSDAVLVAEKAASGKALAAGLMNENGKLNFVVVVVSGDKFKQVVLEPPRAGRQRSAPRRSP